jgi:hypothetical protein
MFRRHYETYTQHDNLGILTPFRLINKDLGFCAEHTNFVTLSVMNILFKNLFCYHMFIAPYNLQYFKTVKIGWEMTVEELCLISHTNTIDGQRNYFSVIYLVHSKERNISPHHMFCIYRFQRRNKQSRICENEFLNKISGSQCSVVWREPLTFWRNTWLPPYHMFLCLKYKATMECRINCWHKEITEESKL